MPQIFATPHIRFRTFFIQRRLPLTVFTNVGFCEFGLSVRARQSFCLRFLRASRERAQYPFIIGSGTARIAGFYHTTFTIFYLVCRLGAFAFRLTFGRGFATRAQLANPFAAYAFLRGLRTATVAALAAAYGAVRTFGGFRGDTFRHRFATFAQLADPTATHARLRGLHAAGITNLAPAHLAVRAGGRRRRVRAYSVPVTVAPLTAGRRKC